MELPAGTLLFRAMNIDPKNPNGMFVDFLGIYENEKFCLSPIHNVFTFPFPWVGFGILDWTTNNPSWMKYNAFQVYALQFNTKVISLISPSPRSRQDISASEPSDSVIQRCNKFPETKCYDDPKRRKDFSIAQGFDLCIRPEGRSVSGWIGISNADSIDVKNKKPLSTPMGRYLHMMSRENPERADRLLCHMFTDSRSQRGFPEIVLHPRVPGQTEYLFRRGDPIKLIEADSKHLTFLPVAVITASGVYSIFDKDIDVGDFELDERVKEMSDEDKKAINFELKNERRKRIEAMCDEFMKREGIRYNIHTGMYVLGKDKDYDTLVPSTTPEDIDRINIFGFYSNKLKFMFKRPDITKVYLDLAAGAPSVKV